MRQARAKVVVADGRVTGVKTAAGFVEADHVISTVPTKLVSRMAPELPADWRARYDAIENMGVCCLVFKLRRSISPHFWVNVADPRSLFPESSSFQICARSTTPSSSCLIICRRLTSDGAGATIS